MFYLFFRYSLADQKKVYEEFKSKEDVIEFIEKKKGEIEIDKIIEAGREFKLNWILKLDEIGKPAPQRRGRPKKKKDEEEKAEPEQVDQEEPDKEQEDKKIEWDLCTECKTTKVATSSGRTRCLKCLELEKKLSSSKEKKPKTLLPFESSANKSKESTGKEMEEERTEFEDDHEGQSWQLEIITDSQGQKKRRCWNPNCKKWFVIEYKGQHYHQDTCRHQHQKRVEAL